MTTCSVRWRSSGGRGEFEFVPADSLLDREISVDFEALSLRIPAEVQGARAEGKPRLRKHDSNNRDKLHLPQLVMAVAGLPEPAREDKGTPIQFPLENKQFVMDEMDFEIVEDDGMSVVLAPLRVSILHTHFQVQLTDRLDAIARDWDEMERIADHDCHLARAIRAHRERIGQGINSRAIRVAADRVIELKSDLFGLTNAGSATTLIETSARPEVDAEEEIKGIEGRLLVRMHVYRERDRKFARMVRKHYRAEAGGQLVCHACGTVPVRRYGPTGESCIEVHHKIPIEQLQPDSVSLVGDMALLCASCHRVVHSAVPCLTVENVNELVATHLVTPTA
ncbi:MAG: HNH endonuclease [Gammaproteobacteria bacterium]|nr:HNH endonuclease [Gammaproteobacteria bacterium]